MKLAFLISFLALALPVYSSECPTITVEEWLNGRRITAEERVACNKDKKNHEEAMAIIRQINRANQNVTVPLWTDAQMDQMAREEARKHPTGPKNIYMAYPNGMGGYMIYGY